MDAEFAPKHKELDEKLVAAEEKLATTTGELGAERLNSDVEKIARGAGINPAAMFDVQERARAIFQLQDGAVIALNDAGEKMMGPGGNLLTIAEFIDGLAADAAYLFGPGGPRASGGLFNTPDKGNGIRRISSRDAGFITVG